jgi:hypothetical protein
MEHEFQWEVQVESSAPTWRSWSIGRGSAPPRKPSNRRAGPRDPGRTRWPLRESDVARRRGQRRRGDDDHDIRLDGFLAAAEKPYAEDPAFSRTLEASPLPDHGAAIDGARFIEARDIAIPWHRHHPVGDGRLVKVVSMAGPEALERVGVEELPDRVTITFWERLPAVLLKEDTLYASAAVATTCCVEVTLTEPLGDRPVYDGATGERPDQIRPGNYGERGWRSEALALDPGTHPCSPMPSPPRTEGGGADIRFT